MTGTFYDNGTDGSEPERTEDVYWFVVDLVAQRCVDELIDSAGDERYSDDVVEGMVQTIHQVVNPWWHDKDIGEESLRTILDHTETTITRPDDHIRTMDVRGGDGGDLAEVDPSDVLQRMALVSFRNDVVRCVTDEYGSDLKQAARGE